MKTTDSKPISLLISSLIGFAISAIIALIIMLVASGVLLASEDPLSLIKPASLFILYTASFLGGFISAKITGSSALSGLISGLLLVIIMLIASGLSPSDETAFSPLLTTVFYALVPILSFFAALLASHDFGKSKKPKFNRRKRNRRKNAYQ